MKYLRGNSELLVFTLIIYLAFVLSTCVLICYFLGFSTWGLTKLIKLQY